MPTVDIELVSAVDAQNPTLGDVRVVGRKLSLVRGADAVAQEANVCIRWWRGEWFLDRTRGVRFLEKLFRVGVTPATARRVLLDDALDLVPELAPHPVITVDIDRATRLGTVAVAGATLSGQPVTLTGVPLAGGG